MPRSSRISVVLPAPLGPSRAKISPRRTSNDTPPTAFTVANAFVTSWTVRMLITLTILHDCDKCGQGKVCQGKRLRRVAADSSLQTPPVESTSQEARPCTREIRCSSQPSFRSPRPPPPLPPPNPPPPSAPHLPFPA